jgi:hydrogenase maturation factor
MCLMQTGVVVARTGDAAIVAVDGRDRLLTSLLVPDLEVGDVVLVGLGTVFARTTADEAAELDVLAATARGTAPSIPTERGN